MKNTTSENTSTTLDFKSNITNTRANLLQATMNSLKWPKNKIAKVLVLGLSGAGKSTFIEFLDKGAIVKKTRKPTLSFQRLLIDFGKFKMVFVDAPGQQIYWSKWSKYISAADGIIFIVDSANFSNVNKVNSLVYQNLQLQKLEKPILFLANKQDLESSLEPSSIQNMLKIEKQLNFSKVYGISALYGRGILDGFKWFIPSISKN